MVLLTGAGHKDAAALDRLAAAPVEPDIPNLAELVARLGQPR